MKPTVSIYIPCRNYGRYLEQAIVSVINQIHTSWELFIIDEASNDETATIGNYYSKKYSDKIKYEYNDRPIGLQRIANKVVAKAQGKYLMRLDADDWLEEYAVLVLEAKLESCENLELAYGNYSYVDEGGKIIGLERKLVHGYEDLSGNIPPHGACTLIRIRTLKAIGGYEERVNAQDGWDIWYKLYQRGRIATVNAPIFYYRQHNVSMSQSKERLLKARSEILRSSRTRLSKDYKLKVLAIIPVKETYGDENGIPYREVGGSSLLKRALDCVGRSDEVTHILVASESENVLRCCEELESKGEAPKHYRQKRSPSSSLSPLHITEVLREGRDFIQKNVGVEVDIVMCISIHSINRTSVHIDNSVDLLLLSDCDSILSVQEIRDPVLRHGERGLTILNMGKFQNLTYDRETLYRFNGAIIAMWQETLATGQPFGRSIGYLEMTNDESMIYTAAGACEKGGLHIQ